MTTDRAPCGGTVERGVAALGQFEFACGETIPELRVAYETYGELDSGGGAVADGPASAGTNAVLVCHALTGSQHVASVEPRSTDGETAEPSSDPSGGQGEDARTAGQARAWWDAVVGPGKAIDTNRYFVVCANVPGSCYGTTGPSSTNPETGEPYGSAFPPVTVGDWTRAQRRLLDELGVGRLHAVVGGSVGGMNALDWAVRYPDDVDRVVPVATAARLDPQCLALDAIARRAITSDPDWQGGDYYGTGPDAAGDDDGETEDGDDAADDGATGGTHPDRGVGLARQIGHVMYLSKDSMRRKFGRRTAGRDAGGRRSADGDGLFRSDPAAAFFPYREAESYLDYQADKFAERFDANSYLALTRAMDEFDLAAGYDSDADALAAFDGEVLLVSFTGDWHFTTEQSAHLAAACREAGVDVAHHVVDSDHGHDAFLVEPETVGPPVQSFLEDGVKGRAVTDAGTDEASTKDQYAPVHSSQLSD